MKKIYFIIAILAILVFGVFVSAHAATILFPSGGGTGRGTLSSGQLLYGAGTNPVSSVATTSVTCSGSTTCTSFTAIGGSPITISSTGGSGGSGTVSTSTAETAGQLSYWTSTSATPALLGKIATTTLTASSPLSLSNPVVKVGGSNSTLTLDTSGTWSGLAGTATALATARNINGVAFDGTAPITITAASSTLLANNNTFSGTNTFSNLITGSISGNAGTATALAANPTNCSAGSYPLGIDASGNVESCTAAGTGTVTAVTGTWPIISSGGTTPNLTWGGLATSTAATLGNIPYFSGVNTFANVATTSHAFSGPFVTSGTIGALIGGSNSTVTWVGLATTSQPSSSNLLVSNGGAGVYGVATSTLTASGPLTGSFTQVGSGGSLGCTTASSGVAGCLSNTAFDTFNNKQAAISATWPIILTGATLSYGGIATSSAISAASGLLYATGVNTLASIATSSPISMSITGNAATVTTNANLTGVITSSGNATSIASQTGTGSTFVVSAAPTLTGLTTLANASSTALSVGATGWLGIPFTANPTVGFGGTLAVDTTSASTSLRYHDGSAERAIYDIKSKSFIIASSTLAYIGAYGASGTTTIAVWNPLHPVTVVSVSCLSDTGSAHIDLNDGTNHTEDVACTTSAPLTTVSTNNTWIMSENFKASVGRLSSAPNVFTITVNYRETVE